MSSHTGGETWGLATHPFKDEFVTVGDDCTVRLWKARSKAPRYNRAFSTKLRCAAYNPKVDKTDGPRKERIAIGMSNGAIVVVNGLLQVVTPPFHEEFYHGRPHYSPTFDDSDIAVNGGPLSQRAGPQQAIRDLKFSPDGKLLAAVCQDQHLYVWMIVDEEEEKQKRLFRAPPMAEGEADMTGVFYSRGYGRNFKASSECYIFLYRKDLASSELHSSPVVHVEWGRDPREEENGDAQSAAGGVVDNELGNISTHSYLLTASERREIKYWCVTTTAATSLPLTPEDAAHQGRENGRCCLREESDDALKSKDVARKVLSRRGARWRSDWGTSTIVTSGILGAVPHPNVLGARRRRAPRFPPARLRGRRGSFAARTLVHAQGWPQLHGRVPRRQARAEENEGAVGGIQRKGAGRAREAG